MQNTLKQFKKIAHKVRLTADEKSTMRGELLRYMKMHPAVSSQSIRIPSSFSISDLRNKKTMPILVSLGILMGGSLSFAAENTVPGDILYPIKTHVNETVRGAVAGTPKAKAEWEVRLAERRLEEVEKLVSTQTALPEVKELAQANLEKSADIVKARIAKFEDDEDSEDALKTAGDFSNMLREHEDALRTLAPQVSATTATTSVTVMPVTQIAVTNPQEVSTQGDIEAARGFVGKLRDNAEVRHQELKKKYNPEQKIEKKNEANQSNQKIEKKKNNTKTERRSNQASVYFASTSIDTTTSELMSSTPTASSTPVKIEHAEVNKKEESKKSETPRGSDND